MVLLHLRRRSIAALFLILLSAYSALECELYIAESSISHAGIGIFSGVAKLRNEFIGNGDKAIPLIDIDLHSDVLESEIYSFDPMVDYVWEGKFMGMALESYDPDGVSAFWPGIDAMINCHPGLLNVEKAIPIYDESGIHRSKHPVAGAVSPYHAGKSLITRDIPVGGEIFKDYGPDWFIDRPWLGQVPLEFNYDDLMDLMITMVLLLDENDVFDYLLAAMFEDLIKELKTVWDSRTLNAIHDFTWDEIMQAIDADDMGVLLQPNATRSIDWLKEHGKCIDHIVHKQHSTIDGAGSGAFAKRDLPKDTIITGTPLLVFPCSNWFDRYKFQVAPDGSVVSNKTGDPSGQQLLLNYCFSHPESTTILCPYGSGVNYINHSQARANVRIQWAKNGMGSHQDASLKVPPKDMVYGHTKVVFDYVAVRDIVEGEELFLDYGDLWETRWNDFVEEWKSHNRETSSENYLSASEFNARHENDTLLTTDEQLLYPYPENLSTRCHSLIGESKRVFSGTASDLFDWFTWEGDNSGYACGILRRDANNESYWVRIEMPNAISKQVSNVPRQAIRFADNPYSTDLHMVGAFRQPIGIPDDILPDAWRNAFPRTSTCQMQETAKFFSDPFEFSGQADGIEHLTGISNTCLNPHRGRSRRIRGA